MHTYTWIFWNLLKILLTWILWKSTFFFCKRFAKQMRMWGTGEPDLRGQLGLGASICRAVIIAKEPMATHYTCPTPSKVDFLLSSLTSHFFFFPSFPDSHFAPVSLPIPDPSLGHCPATESKLPCLSAHTSISSHTGGPVHLGPALSTTSSCLLPSEPGAGLL